MFWALVINLGILSFCLIASRGRIRLFVAYFTVFLSVNSLVMWHHGLPISAALLKGTLLLGLLGVAAAWMIAVSGPSHLAHIRRHHAYAQALPLALLVMMLIGIWFSPDQVYGFEKTRGFAAFAIFPSLILVMLGPYTRGQLAVMGAIIIVSSAVIAFGLLVAAADPGVRATLTEELNVNSVARNLGTGALAALTVLFYGSRRLHPVISIAVAGVALALLAALLLTGSRGPVLGIAVAIFCLLVCSFGVRRLIDLGRSGIVILGVVATIGIGMTVAFGAALKQFDLGQAQRVIELTQRLGDNRSDERRLARYQVALESFQGSNGMGIGTGGFQRVWQGPPLGQGIEDRDYPHNMFLEAASELGVSGILILLGLMAILVRSLVRFAHAGSSPDTSEAVFLGLWLYGIANAQVSGDMATNYLVWVGMTLALLSQAPSSTLLVPTARRT